MILMFEIFLTLKHAFIGYLYHLQNTKRRAEIEILRYFFMSYKYTKLREWVSHSLCLFIVKLLSHNISNHYDIMTFTFLID